MSDPVAGNAAAAVLTLSGEIDVARADAVLVDGEALITSQPAGGRLIIDLGDVSFIDSSGLSSLLRLRRIASEHDVDIVLRDLQHTVAVVLRLGGLDGVFIIE
jgi:anti-anti-sigma factor